MLRLDAAESELILRIHAAFHYSTPAIMLHNSWAGGRAGGVRTSLLFSQNNCLSWHRTTNMTNSCRPQGSPHALHATQYMNDM